MVHNHDNACDRVKIKQQSSALELMSNVQDYWRTGQQERILQYYQLSDHNRVDVIEKGQINIDPDSMPT